MSFFEVDGEKVTGESGFRSIPDGTQARAFIKNATLQEWSGKEHYQIEWKLLDGEFKNRILLHTIKCFDDNKNKKARALNMLYRIFCLAKSTPPEMKPYDDDLLPLRDKIMGIRIGLFINDEGKEYNYIEGVHEDTPAFEVKTGIERVAEPTMKEYTKTANEFFGADKVADARKMKDPFDDQEIPF